ncbi:MAG: hypothetical protein ABSH16_09795 [Sedimentisphaerales bacterium]
MAATKKVRHGLTRINTVLKKKLKGKKETQLPANKGVIKRNKKKRA